MKLAEVFAQLTYGELSQLNLGGAEAGAIDVSNYPNLLAHVNLGLTQLYKRFPLKESRLTVELINDRVGYPLASGYAVSNVAVNGLPRYILDTDEPFQDDLLKIENVFTDLGVELALNDASNQYSIMTPTLNTIRVPLALVDSSLDWPEELDTLTLEVVYRANHPILVMDPATFDPALVEIELPYSHLEPLLFYIASRLHNPIGMTNEFHAGNSWAAKYEQSCMLLEVKNLNVDQGSQNTRIQRNGWV